VNAQVKGRLERARDQVNDDGVSCAGYQPPGVDSADDGGLDLDLDGSTEEAGTQDREVRMTDPP